MKNPSLSGKRKGAKAWAAATLMLTIAGGAKWCVREPEQTPAQPEPLTRVSEGIAKKARKIRPNATAHFPVVPPEFLARERREITPKIGLLPVMNCIQSSEDVICITPDDPRVATCLTLKEDGAVPIRIDGTGEDAILVKVGARVFEHSIDPQDPLESPQELLEICRATRQWLSISFEKVDRAVICHGFEQDALRCDAVSRKLKRLGSVGVQIKQKADAFEKELEIEGLNFVRESHARFRVGTVSVEVQSAGERVVFFVYSSGGGGNPNELIEETDYAVLKVLEVMGGG